MRKRLVAVVAATSLLAACSGSAEDGSSTGTDGTDGAVAGSITVLTNRTDLVDTALPEYAAAFNETYPDVEVTFEAITDYEGEVKTRMNTKDYGDVLLIPNTIAQGDLPDFFEPLGTVADLATTYRFVASEQAFDGQSYGLAITGNAQGIVYNKAVWAAAGVTEAPTSPEEFRAALQAVADKTDAVPLYTNYKDGWPLSWPQNIMGAFTGDTEALVKMSESDAPWTKGEEKYTADSLLFDIAAAGLIEDDPTTTNWENSKNLIATGKIATMVLGSWALPQMQEAATTAGNDPADIGFMPVPVQVDGAYHSPVGGDYKMGININSEHKAAARAWLDWFIADSGFYEVAGALPTVASQPAPASLKEFEATGVKYVEMTPAPISTVIDNAAEIGITQPDYYRLLVDSARGASSETKDQIFAGLNTKWADARAQVG